MSHSNHYWIINFIYYSTTRDKNNNKVKHFNLTLSQYHLHHHVHYNVYLIVGFYLGLIWNFRITKWIPNFKYDLTKATKVSNKLIVKCCYCDIMCITTSNLFFLLWASVDLLQWCRRLLFIISLVWWYEGSSRASTWNARMRTRMVLEPSAPSTRRGVCAIFLKIKGRISTIINITVFKDILRYILQSSIKKYIQISWHGKVWPK